MKNELLNIKKNTMWDEPERSANHCTCVRPEFLGGLTWSPLSFAAGQLCFWQYATAWSLGLHLTSTIKKNKKNFKNIFSLCWTRKITYFHWSPTWKVLDGCLAGLGEGNVSTSASWIGLSSHCSLAVCLGSGKLIVQQIKSILNYCALSGNLILSKLSRKRDKPD